MIPPSAANVISLGPLNSCDPFAMVFGFIGPVSYIESELGIAFANLSDAEFIDVGAILTLSSFI